MKIRITFNVDDEVRQALARSCGRKGKATREDVIAEIHGVVSDDFQTLWDEYTDGE